MVKRIAMTNPPKVGPAMPRRLEALRRRLSGLDPHGARPADRVERVASRFGSAFSISISIALMLIIVAVGFVAVKEFIDDGVYIEPISVPPGLVEQGITPTVVATRIVQRVAAIKAEADRRDVNDEAQVAAEPQRQDLVLITGGISVPRLVAALKRALGRPDLRIVGEIIRTDGKLRMGATFLKNGVHADTVINVEGQLLDNIADRGAKLVLLLSNPDVLTSHTLYSELARPTGPDRFTETLAILEFRERQGLERASPAVRNWHATVDALNGDYVAAMKVWDALAAEGWQPVQSRIYAAHAAIELKDFERATRLADQVRASPSVSVRELVEIAVAYSNAGKTEESQQAVMLAFSRNPNNAYTRAYLAFSLQYRHRESEARRLLEAVPMPRDKATYLLHASAIAAVSAQQGDFKRVSEMLRLAEKDLATSYEAQGIRAEDAVGRDLELADRLWRELAENQPAWSEPRVRRADVVLLRGDFTKALAMYDRCLEDTRYETRCRVGRARTLVKLGKPADADRAFAHLFELDKDDVKALREWSAVLKGLGRSDEAAQKLALAAAAERRLAIPIDIPGASKR